MFSKSIFFQLTTPHPRQILSASTPSVLVENLIYFLQVRKLRLWKIISQGPRLHHFVWHPSTQSPGPVCPIVLLGPRSSCSLPSEMKTWRHALLGHPQEHLGHIVNSCLLTVQISGFPQGTICNPPPPPSSRGTFDSVQRQLGGEELLASSGQSQRCCSCTGQPPQQRMIWPKHQ